MLNRAPPTQICLLKFETSATWNMALLGNWVIAGAILQKNGSLINSYGVSIKRGIYIKKHKQGE